MRVLARRLLPALACAALLLVSACAGVRSSEQKPAAGGRPPAAGELRLVISRDYGARVLKDILVPARAGMTVMRLLAEHCQVDTKYGGGFIQSVDGLESSFGASSTTSADWFYWVDGVMGTVGAGDAALHGGQTAWLDYHRWDGAIYIPGALAAFPAPFKSQALSLVVQASSGETDMSVAVQAWAQRRGIRLRAVSPSPSPGSGPQSSSSGASSAPQLIVGTPTRMARDSTVGPALSRGAAAGVFVVIDSGRLYTLRADGTRGQELSAAALAVSDPDHTGRLCLVLIAQDAPALRRLLGGFTAAAASAHVALGLTAGGIIALPAESANAPLAVASGGEK